MSQISTNFSVASGASGDIVYTLPTTGSNSDFVMSGVTDVTSGSQNVAAGGKYLSDKGTLTTFTLPPSPASGDRYEIYGVGSGGWTVVYNSGQHINFGNVTTTTTTGSISSSNQYDAAIIIAVSTTQFVVYPLVGNITWV